MFARVPLDGQRDNVLLLGPLYPLTSAVLVRVRVLGVRGVQGALLFLLRLILIKIKIKAKRIKKKHTMS